MSYRNVFVLSLCLAACGVDDARVGVDDPTLDDDQSRFSSSQATLMSFTFTSQLWVPGSVSASGARSYIDEQMLFTIGHLNANRSVGRLDKVTLSNIKTQVDGVWLPS